MADLSGEVNAKTATIVLLALAALVLVLLLIPSGTPAPLSGKSDTLAADRRSPEQPSADAAASAAGIGAVAVRAGDVGQKAAAGAGAGAGERGRDREQRLAKFAARLAALPPEDALARIRELSDQDSRDEAMLALLGEWSGLGSLELIRRGDVWRFGSGGALAVYLLDNGKITPAQAAALAQENTDGNHRGELFVRIGAKMAAENPAAALALGDGLEGWQRQHFLEGLAHDWADASPDEARRWISSVSDPRTRDALVAGLLDSETRRNPAQAAANFTALLPADDSTRARTAMRIASEWASKDTISAMQWAESLGGEAERTAAAQGIRNTAPVGIGAMLNRGPDGLPVIGNLVPGGPASVSGTLQPGDTLLAVSDANGAWRSDTRNMSFREILGLIRGEPNTQVSLQVQSPGSSTTRVVTLGRQQLIFRPQ